MVSRFSRFFAMAVLAISTLVMLTASFDAEARRFGGGLSFGRQSSNILKQRRAVPPPKAATPAASSRATPSANRASGQSAAAPRSGLSRFMAPFAGILAGLGIAALLSHLGLSGAFFELLFLVAFIALAVMAIRFVLRRLGNPGALAAQASQRSALGAQTSGRQPVMSPSAATASPMARMAESPKQVVQPHDPSWFIPADFDLDAFLENAKNQFRAIQAYWDKASWQELSQYLTPDLLAELQSSQMVQPNQNTEILLLNAELLGIETLKQGYLASVRYSGLIRETPQAEAVHFNEVWNLHKTDQTGWMVAGIQQLPSNHHA